MKNPPIDEKRSRPQRSTRTLDLQHSIAEGNRGDNHPVGDRILPDTRSCERRRDRREGARDQPEQRRCAKVEPGF